MDLNQLKYFEIIAKNENLSKAEKILHIAQPALSTSLARMEKQLGVKLFERNKGRLELNNYGEILLKYVLRINAEYEAALHEIEITKNENENTLNIAVLDMGFSLDLIFQFITNNPHIKVNPRIIARDPEIELDLDEYDIIITPLPETFPNMEYVPILTEQFSLVVSNDHKFCKQNKICFEDLNGENIICTAYRSHFANYVQKLIIDKKIIPASFEYCILTDIAKSVVHYNAVSIVLPGIYRQMKDYEGIRLLTFNPPITRQTGFAFPTNRKKKNATKEFYKFICANSK